MINLGLFFYTFLLIVKKLNALKVMELSMQGMIFIDL